MVYILWPWLCYVWSSWTILWTANLILTINLLSCQFKEGQVGGWAYLFNLCGWWRERGSTFSTWHRLEKFRALIREIIITFEKYRLHYVCVFSFYHYIYFFAKGKTPGFAVCCVYVKRSSFAFVLYALTIFIFLMDLFNHSNEKLTDQWQANVFHLIKTSALNSPFIYYYIWIQEVTRYSLSWGNTFKTIAKNIRRFVLKNPSLKAEKKRRAREGAKKMRSKAGLHRVLDAMAKYMRGEVSRAAKPQENKSWKPVCVSTLVKPSVMEARAKLNFW